MGQPAIKEELFERARDASERLMIARDDSREIAVRTIRALEAKLCEAIAGDTLRGLSVLVEHAPRLGEYQAARVHGGERYGIDAYIPNDGRWALVISKDGRLTMARVTRPGQWECRQVDDVELRSEDLEPFTRAVQQVLERHTLRAERTYQSYARTLDLARRLAAVVGLM